jgi:hypothetical protein
MVPPNPYKQTAPRGVTAEAITAAVAASIGASVGGIVAAPVDEELWERRMRALTLRNMGATFTRIAAELGISASVARADVRLAYREVLNETTEDFVARQRSVLLDCQRGAYPLALQGDKDAIMAIVRCLEQEAKLLGLYAPARMAVGISDVDFAEQAAELISKLGLTPPRELMPHATGTQRADLATNLARATEALNAAEIVDGILERIADLGFDIPAFDLPIDADLHCVEGVDNEIGAVAAAAIDPDRFGSRHRSASGDAGDEGADQNGAWSNL